ncbi:MAG: site-specific integrase, partial [Archangium sp.]|nr:site-specific integrase [Archangium sp.]
DLESKADRQRLGLEPLERAGDELTFGDLFLWWSTVHASKLRSTTQIPFAAKHLTPVLGDIRLPDISPGVVEALLAKKDGLLKPKSINNLRQILAQIFNLAIRHEKWGGENPVTRVAKRRVPKRLPTALAFEEVPLLLQSLNERWRPLFATALYTGMRLGELLGLRKMDVDLNENVIRVCRSYDSDTTKGGSAESLPIAKDLKPFLEKAMRDSKSQLVFPKPDGTMHPRGLGLDKVLRTALGRAGVVVGYKHVCRRSGCKYQNNVTTNAPARCPRCTQKLWVQPVPRHVRFHDLRHTTATLMLKTGVAAAAVQRMLRHKDARLTLQTYGHLDMEDMRQGVDAMDLGLSGTRKWIINNDAVEQNLQALQNLSAPVVRPSPADVLARLVSGDFSSEFKRLMTAPAANQGLVPNQVLYQAEPLPDAAVADATLILA